MEFIALHFLRLEYFSTTFIHAICYLFFKNEPRETLEIFPFLYFIKKNTNTTEKGEKKICAFNKETHAYILS